MLFKKKNNCRLCNSKHLFEILDLGRTPIGDNYTKNKNKSQLIPLKLFCCDTCNFKQTSHVVNEKKVYGDYLYTTSTSAGLRKHFQESFKFLKKFHNNLNKNDLILDIGSNDGSNLEIFKKNTFNVIGVEPARSLAKLSNKKKILTLNSFFNKQTSNLIKNKYGTPKIICIYNLFANIDDLDEFVKNLLNLIDKNTIIAIESFSLLGIIKDNLFDHIYHEHLSYFHIESLKIFFKKYGLSILYAEYNKIKGSSIKIFIGKNKKLISHSSIKSSIKLEKKIKVNQISSFDKIKINKSKFINSFNKELKKLNIKKIAGFGASCGSTTFIYYLNLFNKLEYFIDDEPRRNKLYAPNSNIQVFNFKSQIIEKLDAILVISWRYEGIIFKKFIKKIKQNKIKNKKKLYWIIPYPKFKIKEIKL